MMRGSVANVNSLVLRTPSPSMNTSNEVIASSHAQELNCSSTQRDARKLVELHLEFRSGSPLGVFSFLAIILNSGNLETGPARTMSRKAIRQPGRLY